MTQIINALIRSLQTNPIETVAAILIIAVIAWGIIPLVSAARTRY